MDRPIHIIGGGIAGLVAAITAAESGAPVVVRESGERVGGRAVGGTSRSGVNLGPHVVFTDGALLRWLRAQQVPIALLGPPLRGMRLLDDRGMRLPLVESALLATTLVPRRAPIDESFREWTDRVFGTPRALLLCRLAGLFTFHHDPGSLSASFVWERYRRSVLSPDRTRWIAGGWSSLVDALAQRALALGVRIECRDRVTPATFPVGPTIVATTLVSASRLLERRLHWSGARTALLDVVAAPGARWPTLVADVRSDLSTCCMIERETAIERELLGPSGDELFQAHLGIAPGVPGTEGVERIEDSLDQAAPGWREKTIWRRGHAVVDSTGAVDPPGTSWRDRPSIDQGDDRFLAGDSVAAPGMLSEVAVNSGIWAARLALQARRQRTFAVGWPSVDLTPDRRFAVLAAALPGASMRTVATSDTSHDRWAIEPVDETGPGYRLWTRAGVLRGVAATATPVGVRVATVVSRRWRGPVARFVSHVVDGWGPARLGSDRLALRLDRPRRR